MGTSLVGKKTKGGRKKGGGQLHMGKGTYSSKNRRTGKKKGKGWFCLLGRGESGERRNEGTRPVRKNDKRGGGGVLEPMGCPSGR